MSPSAMRARDNHTTNSDTLLSNYNFPANYVDMAHPNDGKIMSTPVTPEFIRHSRRGHFGMLVRISLRLDDNQFISYTFVCDTAARVHFYFSKKTVAFLKSAGRIETDEESGAYFLIVAGRKAAVRVTPQTHQPVNFMGMLMLERLGLEMSEGSFTFAHPLPYL